MKDNANNHTNHGIITNEILRPFRDELAEVKIKSFHKSMDKVNNQQFSLEKYSSVNKSINFPNDELPRSSNPEDIINFIQLLSDIPPKSEVDFDKKSDFSPKQLHDCQILGLIKSRELTNKSRALLSIKTNRSKYAYLAILLESSRFGRSLISWSEEKHLAISISGQVEDFVKNKIPSLSRIKRREICKNLKLLINNLAPHHPKNRHIETRDRENDNLPLIKSEPIFESNVIDLINRNKKDIDIMRISTGFMSAEGYDMVARGLQNSEIRLLLGRDDSRGLSILSNPIEYFKKSVNFGFQSRNKKLIHQRLYNELVNGSTRIRKTRAKTIDSLHGKLFIGDNRWALPSSANLSVNGLMRNIETGKLTIDPDDINYFIEKFEEYWNYGEDITTEIIEELVESWIFEPPVDPYLTYIRGLMEIYGNLASKSIGNNYQLATFQKMIVGYTIRSLRENNAALVISPTGTGKTIMGSYIIAAMKDKFKKAVIFANNKDLIDKWEHFCLSFGIRPYISTHSKLQHDIENFKQTDEGKKLNMWIDNETLVVVDEAHRFRTENTQGSKLLEQILDGTFNHFNPSVLLLTATPIGTGIQNLQRLYELLNLGPAPEKIEDFSELPGLVNVTLPFIMERFGRREKTGDIPYLEFGSENMYYARRKQSIIPINDHNEHIYDIIDNIDFDEIKNYISLDNFGIDIPPATVDNMTLPRINIARTINSSKAAGLAFVQNLLDRIPDRNYINKEKIERQLNDLIRKINLERNDKRYETLLQILSNSDTMNKKIIINCEHIQTRINLVARLKKDTRRKVVEYDGSTSEKRKIREYFAPSANSKEISKNKQIDILVATGGLSEGHDLQDAELIINYDLWWTPIRLQQRMGRLDRPTEKPREFTVLTLVNINQSFNDKVSMNEKLIERSLILKKLIEDGAYEPNEDRDFSNLSELQFGVRTLPDHSADLEFEMISTSRHIADLAEASEQDIGLAMKLVPGFTSSFSREISGTFIMTKNNLNIYTAFLHDDNMVSFAPGDHNYDKLLSNIRADKSTPISEITGDHYESVDILFNSLCEKHNLEIEETEIIFSVSLN